MSLDTTALNWSEIYKPKGYVKVEKDMQCRPAVMRTLMYGEVSA